MRIAILGATGHVGKNMAERFGRRGDVDLYLFARDAARARAFCDSLALSARLYFPAFSEFRNFTFDAVVNCVGIADSGKLANAGREIFRVTEEFDNLVLDYMDRHEACRYVNFSSGAAYGSDFSEPVDDRRKASYSLNPARPEEYYGLAKLYAEAKHRVRADRHIVDLRLFGFFSKHIDIEGKFLLSDAARCLLKNQKMETGSTDIMRDYVHPDDLFRLVDLSLDGERRNMAVDVYSQAAAGKFALLDILRAEFGLEYGLVEQVGSDTATGTKKKYFSLNHHEAQYLGYQPLHSSIEAVRVEMRELLMRRQ